METFIIFAATFMIEKFKVVYLEEVRNFLASLTPGARGKVIYNIEKASMVNDPELFKKLDETVWEFRTNYQNQKIRLFAFWDSRDRNQKLVIATHGIIKKKSKVNRSEIEKTKKIRNQYLGKI
jgi:hypothetical protein